MLSISASPHTSAANARPPTPRRIESELAVDPRLQYAAQLLGLALPATSDPTEPDVEAALAEIKNRIERTRTTAFKVSSETEADRNSRRRRSSPGVRVGQFQECRTRDRGPCV